MYIHTYIHSTQLVCIVGMSNSTLHIGTSPTAYETNFFTRLINQEPKS